MEFWKLIALIVIVGFILNSFAPDLYEKSYGAAWSLSKDQWSNYKKSDDTSQEQDIVLPDGTIVSPTPGTNFGKPYDYFDCKEDEQCKSRFSINAICDTKTGECIIP